MFVRAADLQSCRVATNALITDELAIKNSTHDLLIEKSETYHLGTPWRPPVTAILRHYGPSQWAACGRSKQDPCTMFRQPSTGFDVIIVMLPRHRCFKGTVKNKTTLRAVWCRLHRAGRGADNRDHTVSDCGGAGGVLLEAVCRTTGHGQWQSQ